MIAGLGVDLVEVRRVRGLLDRHGERFLERCFDRREVLRPEDPEHLAGLLAAKEAAFKALGPASGSGIAWKNIQVLRRDPASPPRLVLSGAAASHATSRGIVHAHLSITHHGGMAAAVVILEA
ncbi:MAG: holo-[acyl-carrier-protein] synthase [Acidobacteria bacterium]|nr:holo-[acyl-carrier-protein] synthase [Acidobacteriota bacterium]